MAESSSQGSWWDSWVQTAKEKSAQAYEQIKADLSEFKTVCTTDASQAVASTAERLQTTIQGSGENSSTERVKHGFSQLLGGITKVLTVPPDDEEDTDVLRVTPSGNFEVFDKAKARLYEIQTSPQTYCTEPDGPVDKFNEWRASFDLDSKKGDISELLVSVNEMRGIYTKLVPSAVSHSDFWERYFYKVYQLDLDEKRKADLKQRAENLKIDNSGTNVWEDDWESEDTTSPNQEPANELPCQITFTADVHAEDEPLPTEATPRDKGIEPLLNNQDTMNKHQSENKPQFDNSPRSDNDENSLENELRQLTVSDTSDNHKKTLVNKPAENIPDQQIVSTDTIMTSLVKESASSDVTEQQSTSAVAAVELSPGKSAGKSSESQHPVEDIKVKEKGGYVMLGSERPTPTSSVGSSNAKDSSSLDDDWEKELFGDDMKAVHDLAQKIGEGKADVDLNDDWEDWE